MSRQTNRNRYRQASMFDYAKLGVQAYNAYKKPTPKRKYTKTSSYWNKKSTGAGGQGKGATNSQKPTAVMYKRRPAPRRVKQRARKSQQEYLRNQFKVNGAKTAIFNKVSNFDSINANAAGYSSAVLNNGQCDNPLSTVRQDYYNLFTSVSNTTDLTGAPEMIRIDTANMETTLTNYCDVALELKIYSVSAKKNSNQSPSDTYVSGFVIDNTLDNALSGVVGPTSTFATPFDQSLFGKYWTIHKLTKTILEPNQTTSWIKKETKNRIITQKQLELPSSNPAAVSYNQTLAGITSGYLFTWVPLGTPTVGTDKLRLETVRRYKFTYGSKIYDRIGASNEVPTAVFTHVPMSITSNPVTALSAIPVIVENTCQDPIPVELCKP